MKCVFKWQRVFIRKVFCSIALSVVFFATHSWAATAARMTVNGSDWLVNPDLTYSVDIDGDGAIDNVRHLVSANDQQDSLLVVVLANGNPNQPSAAYSIGKGTQIRRIDYDYLNEAILVEVIDPVTHAETIVRRIRLHFRRGKLRFIGEEVKTYDGWDSLAGTNWWLSPVATNSTVPISSPVTMSIDGESVYGRSGCNQYRGDLVSDDKLGLRIERISNTRKMCTENAMSVESWFLGALNQVTGFGFDSGRLVMQYACDDGENCERLVFEATE